MCLSSTHLTSCIAQISYDHPMDMTWKEQLGLMLNILKKTQKELKASFLLQHNRHSTHITALATEANRTRPSRCYPY